MNQHLPTLVNPLKDHMTSNTIYHYVYRITNIVENKHYYGKRSSKCDPKQDLGIKYFSSSKDKVFKADQKNNPQNYRYKIVRIFASCEAALNAEILLHEKFDVALNPNFYNRAKQTSTKFDTTGINLFSDELRAKMSLERTGSKNHFFGKKHTKEASDKMKASSKGKNSGITNCKFSGYFITPFGTFATRRSIIHTQVCDRSVAKWCKKNDLVINRESYNASVYLRSNYPNSIVGTTYRDIGFSFMFI